MRWKLAAGVSYSSAFDNQGGASGRSSAGTSPTGLRLPFLHLPGAVENPGRLYGHRAAGGACPAFAHFERPTRAGFTLPELLVVLGIISLLLSLLMPVLTKSRMRAASIKCQSNMRQNYMFLQMYANDHKGYIFPYDFGTRVPREQRWPVYVFSPAVWNPLTMLCPADLEPAEDHSYVLNAHIVYRNIRFGRNGQTGAIASDIILMGEKKSIKTDYYMQLGEFDWLVDEHRHGLADRSNYLFLDGHVDGRTSQQAKAAIDPWDPTH